ncbi:MAG: SRPBCC domain-containing protein [Polyangiaceae bacterium]|nr:SRPBCC domain-containing protein [Myxococcales bacterium]MCB9587070.1 SRPBCC domain-containing protein [Polyangiaceae bacterium]
MRATIEQDTLTIRFARRIQASPQRVFDAWTQADQLTEWWDPTGERLESCDVDLRVGGAFCFRNKHHSQAFAGTYVEITPPSRLVFEAMGAVGTVLLEAKGSETHMEVTIRCSSPEHLEQFVNVGVAENTDITLDNLVRHVSGASAFQHAELP